jgi:hypothetical protein
MFSCVIPVRSMNRTCFLMISLALSRSVSMESNMPAKPDESKRLIKFFEFQTDAPLLGEPRNYSHVYRVAVGDRRQHLDRNASESWWTIRPACPAGPGFARAIVRTWSSSDHLTRTSE